MQLVMTLLVRDEADIVDANIRYHLAQGVDHIIAMDNRSVDGTTRILRDHERAGHLRYLYQAGRSFRQSEWVTRMARLAATDHAADWVINNDADEFWWPLSGDLRSSLATIEPDAGLIEAPRSNLAARPERLGSWVDRMVVRETQSRNALGQPLPGKVCHRAHRHVEVAPGNHDAAAPGLQRWRGPAPIEIMHLPMRSPTQMLRKVGHAREAIRADRQSGAGDTWVRLVELDDAGRFADWYASQELDDRAVERGIADGTLVEDRRIQSFLAAHDIPASSPTVGSDQIAGKLAMSLRRISLRSVRR